jgi:hypothetical protein
MKTTLRIVLSLCFFLLAFPIAAQDKPSTATPAADAPMFFQVMIVRVKPDMVREYMELQKNETVPALKKAGVKSREAYSTGAFGENFEFVFVTDIENFAQYDGPNPIVRALGEEGAAAYFAKNRKLIEGSRTYAFRARPDLSFFGTGQWAPAIAVVTMVEVALGRNAEFENFIKNDWVPALKKANVQGYAVSQAIFGGNANEYVTVTLFPNYAELDKGPPVVRALGQEAADKLMTKMNGVIVRADRSISKFEPTLSFMPPAPPAK